MIGARACMHAKTIQAHRNRSGIGATVQSRLPHGRSAMGQNNVFRRQLAIGNACGPSAGFTSGGYPAPSIARLSTRPRYRGACCSLLPPRASHNTTCVTIRHTAHLQCILCASPMHYTSIGESKYVEVYLLRVRPINGRRS